MRGKLVLLIGVGIGYVLGARAGRGRYEEIKRAFTSFWNDPRVKHQVHNVEDFARDKAPEVVDFLGSSVKKVVSRTSNAEKPVTKRPAAKKPASSSSSADKK